jgi:hypothetical protein
MVKNTKLQKQIFLKQLPQKKDVAGKRFPANHPEADKPNGHAIWL